MAQTPVWMSKTPIERNRASMAYDSARKVSVMFGGFTDVGANAIRETWEWDGSAWKFRTASGPSGREWAAMAYDPVRRVVVLFGGKSDEFSWNDTWEWDGHTWTAKAISGPSYRYASAMCYDSNRNKMVLFGGSDGSFFGDTWEYDGASWTKVATTGPGARYAAGMCYDPVRQRAVLFGGRNGTGVWGDTWEWNGTSWTSFGNGGPQARWDMPMIFDPVLNKPVLFGGDFTSAAGVVGPLADTWVRTGTTWSQASTGSPAARTGHCGAFDVARSAFVVFGGRTGSNSSVHDTWTRLGGAWVPTFDSRPVPRGRFAMAYDSGRGRSVMYGGLYGYAGDPYPLRDTWERSGDMWLPRSAGVTYPQANMLPQMVHDPARSVTLLIGGTNTTTFANSKEMWTWNGSAWTKLVSQVPPAAGDGGALAFDSARGVVVRFGGGVNGLINSDTWEWNGASWSQRLVAGPPARLGALAYDAARGVCVLFGGTNSFGTTFTDTWEWNGTVWTQKFMTSPGTFETAYLTYDTSRQKVLLYGVPPHDTLFRRTSQVWEYDGVSWTQLSAAGPLGRDGAQFVYDAARRSAILFGGQPRSSSYSDETWEFRVPCEADLNDDRNVDDTDFVSFATAYNVLDCAAAAMPSACPSDLNHDNFVDDSDFVLFAAAYDALGCP
ncbi:MAG: hypothetical protein K2Y21_09755 [Phycisphaerales bacterium]|nr:hypothetical protein [Phycisphaerales bacterium]